LQRVKTSDWILLALLVLVIFTCRLPFLLSPVLGGDAAYHARAAVTVLNGGLLYGDVPYTYPPLYAYTEALAIAMFGNTDFGWKVTAQMYDLGIVVLIFLIVSRISSRKKALVAAGLYGFSPLPFFATSSYASFDSTAAFWMLAGLLLLIMKKPFPSAIALGIGAAYKYFPIIILPAAFFYLVTKRQKLLYTATSIATVFAFQLPFVVTELNLWLDNVILFHVNRAAGGASIYNMLSLHPTLWDAQTPLTILSPIALLLAFSLIALSENKSDLGLIKNSAFILVVAVFFNKVVLFYALWYIPLICILVVLLKKHVSTLILALSLISQVAILTGGYLYNSIGNDWATFAAVYVYLVASGLLLGWLLYDRLISAKRPLNLRQRFRNLYEKT
jgi:uncharacterized membrane protein